MKPGMPMKSASSDSDSEDVNVNVENDGGKNNMSEYDTAPSIAATDGVSRPVIDAKAAKLVNDEFERCKRKYGWQESGNCCVKCVWKFYYFITGLLVTCLILIPFLLFELFLWFFMFIIYLLTFKCCCRMKSFSDFFRTFLGKTRIHLEMVPQSKRRYNIFWHFIDRITFFYAFLEVVIFGRRIHHLKMSYKRLFGDIYPMFGAICMSSYKDCFDVIHDFKSTRKSRHIAFPFHRDIQSYLLPQTLSNSDPRHEIAKDLVNIICQFDVSAFANVDSTSQDVNFVEMTKSKLSGKKAKVIEEAYYSHSLWYYVTGILGSSDGSTSGKDVEFTPEEVAMIGNNGAASTMAFVHWLHFLVGNNSTLRSIYMNVRKHGFLFEKYCKKYNPSKWNKVLKYCETNGINLEAGLGCIGCNMMFAGGRDPVRQLVGRSKLDDSEGESKSSEEKTLFNSDKKSYIREINRWHHNVLGGYNECSEARTFTIGGKEYTFPAGTSIGGMCIESSQLKTHFKDPDSFDVNRDFDQCMIFNCLDKYLENSDDKYDIHDVSFRYCPGRHIGILSQRHCANNLFNY